MLALFVGCDRSHRDVTPDRQVLVSAAASLTDAFSEIEAAFETARPDVDVVLNVGGSSALREQILDGAPIDVFAPADADEIDRVAAAGHVAGAPRVFARNHLRIAVPRGNPGAVAGLADFADASRLIGLCTADVPCGELARRTLGSAGVAPSIDTHEPDVRALLARIEAGELDAGIVYVTDIRSTAGAVEGIDIPEVHDAVAVYAVVVLTGAPNPQDAAAFVAFLVSDEGRAILEAHGFSAP